MSARTIITKNIYPPIPDRRFDWVAYFDGDEEAGPRGWGKTEQAAVDDLRTNYEEEGSGQFPVTADNQTFKGMSLRDWFAGQALVSIAASPVQDAMHGEDKEAVARRFSQLAYKLADAMLAERAKVAS